MMNTLNYSEASKAFMSFIDTNPAWYIDLGDKYYSFDNNGIFRLHNNGLANALNPTITTNPVSNSVVKTVTGSKDFQSTKVFDNVDYVADFALNENFLCVNFNTKTNRTVPSMTMINTKLMEDTYYFSIPRESNDKFAGRLKGKYLISEYIFNSSAGNYFSLPYIKTKYRQSNI